MKIIECPRDAWQGLHSFIPTEKKTAYLQQLLKVGFDTIDFGSFVSPKAMPQVRDTAQILDNLDVSGSDTKLLAIVANERGALEASKFSQITDIGYPFSISETFQMRNTNAGISASLERLRRISEVCQLHQKNLVVYISMGFGNPYGDPWNPEIVMHWIEQLVVLEISTFSLADTVGLADVSDISCLFSQIIKSRPDLEIGAHFHTTPENWKPKIEAAYEAGCRRFDGALLGYGGCPMAQNDLVGNMPTERLAEFAAEKQELPLPNQEALNKARNMFLELVVN